MARPRSKPPRNPELAALGKVIEQLIADTPGMTLRTVAEDAGLELKQAGTYARGLGNPTFLTLHRLCVGLRISPGELMRRVDAELERKS